MKIIESPREGMQSLQHVIPTEKKVSYISQLFKTGFDTVEVGSIVSPKHIPQMADTLEVIRQVDFSGTLSNRMVLVVSKKGAEMISEVKEITHISYPFSISSGFLKLNLNTTIEKAFATVDDILNICARTGKEPVIYISMAFGNPYGDPWNVYLLLARINMLKKMGVKVIPLSNVAIPISPELIRKVFSTLIPEIPSIEFGLHLHTTNENWQEGILAAYDSGCRRFDSVIGGYGGCPMSGKEMLGNLATENLVSFAESTGESGITDKKAFTEACRLASMTFAEPAAN